MLKSLWLLSEQFVNKQGTNPIFISPQGLFSASTVPGGSVSKESAHNVGDLGLIPELGRSPGEGNSNPVQYSCRENPMNRAWRAAAHGVAKPDTTERLS